MTILSTSFGLAATLLCSQADDVDFQRDVRPLLAKRCFACHGNDEETREAGLRLDSFAEAAKNRDGFAALVPQSLEDSGLWLRIIDDIDPMPPEHAGPMLDAEERLIIRRWIESGGAYEPHWSFVPPKSPDVPAVPSNRSPAGVPAGTHPIDAFIDRRLAIAGLTRQTRASDEVLVRRIHLDLTGLPPSPDAARAFIDSTDPDKVDDLILQLLGSPAYAERWASVWLDLARYADSAGHGSDPLRTIWRYRDWVIEAFDQNMPFDEFTVQQLAGDLLEEPTRSTRLATAFHRNTMTNTEGGTDDEEFRVLAVKDRVNTTMQVWMGLTAGCAECHSHKYDPISHVEYYQLFDVFNQSSDEDRADEEPRLLTPTSAQEPEWQRNEAAIQDVDRALARALAGGDSRGVDSPVMDTAALETLRTSLDLSTFERGTAIEVVGTVGADETPEPSERLADGSTFFAESSDTATRTATFAALSAPSTQILLEALPDEALPKKGPGQNSASGNFVLTHLEAWALPPQDAPREALTRRVRIELPGQDRILSLAEVELLDSAGDRIDVAGIARQSSTAHDGDAGHAFDRNTASDYATGSVTHTGTEADPWWEVELAHDVVCASLRVTTRTDGGHAARLHGFTVTIFDANGDTTWRSALAPAPKHDVILGPAAGQPVLLEAVSATHQQHRFEAGRAVDGIVSDRDGWAIGGGEGRYQAAIYRLSTLDAAAPLRIRMEHQWGTEHVLGRLRISVSDSALDHAVLSESVRDGLDKDPAARTPTESKVLAKFLAERDPEVARLRASRARLFTERDALGVVSTPVMVERVKDDRRDSHVLVRGNFLQKSEQVTGAIPAAFGELDAGDAVDRLELARWLVSDENPLTARVAVNRVWARLFGRGIVATEGDFGSQGDTPTHPDLLDWLAVEFRTRGWDHKDLLRSIMLSEAYQQSSVVRDESLQLDPDASLLSRFPRQRLEAEMVRDVTLSIAGLLSPKRFGPSVFPPQPDGLWQAAFNNERTWEASSGEDRYRRGLYVFLRRTIPYPMLATFDAPSREACTVQRIPTNTPLQAFVTLNDAVFVEAAQAFGRSLMADAQASTDAEALARGFERATGRACSAGQAGILGDMLGAARHDFSEGGEADARAFATDPLGPLDADVRASEAAAWTLIANILLNLDAVLTKE